jgi:hypothetical protein
MDQEVTTVDVTENSVTIDYDPQKNGFSLFYVTFEGILHMKRVSSELRPFKLSFMIEGRLVREGAVVKETVVTVKATKMDIGL